MGREDELEHAYRLDGGIFAMTRWRKARLRYWRETYSPTCHAQALHRLVRIRELERLLDTRTPPQPPERS